MTTFDNLDEQQKKFFNSYFAAEKNGHKLYWEKAYLSYLNYQTLHDKIAATAETTMDAVYAACTLFNSFAPCVGRLSQVVPIVGIVWNMIDVAGTLALVARDAEKRDRYAASINGISAAQLTVGTVFFTLMSYSKKLHVTALSHFLTGNLGLAGGMSVTAGASSFAFAAAMAFAYILECREVNLHKKRIEYLTEKIQEIEKNFESKSWLEKDLVNSANGEQEINLLERCIKSKEEKESENNNSDLPNLKDLLELKKFRLYQEQQLEVHQRARFAWGLSTVFMTGVAIVSVAIVALGIGTLTTGMAISAASSACAFLFSALYRNNPKFFENSKKTVKQSVFNLFRKPEPNFAIQRLESLVI